jgi:hypothetical protein
VRHAFEPVEAPRVDAFRFGESLVLECPWCGEWHQHGLGAGHRVAHCRERGDEQRSYFLVVVGVLDRMPRRRRRPRRQQ